MANGIKIKRSNTLGAVPAVLLDGEIAINQADKKLFYNDALGVIQVFDLTTSGGMTTIEMDLGYPAKSSGSFLITGLSGLTVNRQVVIAQACGPYTGKGDSADEFEMDSMTVSAYVLDANTIKAHYNATGLVGGNFKFNYLIQ